MVVFFFYKFLSHALNPTKINFRVDSWFFLVNFFGSQGKKKQDVARGTTFFKLYLTVVKSKDPVLNVCEEEGRKSFFKSLWLKQIPIIRTSSMGFNVDLIKCL